MISGWHAGIFVSGRRGTFLRGTMQALTAGWVFVTATAGAAFAGSDAAPRRAVWACHVDDGSIRIEMAAPTRSADGCHPIAVPVPADAVRWAAWLPATLAQDDRIVLTGSDRGRDFVPSGARILDRGGTEAPQEHDLPIGAPLLSAIRPHAFGVEERASAAMTESAVQVSCGPGANAAGLVLDPGPRSLPALAGLLLHWRGEGDPGFSVGIVRAGAALDLGTGFDRHGSAAVSLPVELETRNNPHLVVLCPATGGVLRITDLRIAAPVRPSEPSRAAWMWQPESWREKPASLVENAKRLGMTRLFIAADIDEGGLRNGEALASFVSRARTEGITVVVVEGDPAMVLEAGRATALKRLRVLADYQQVTPPEGRLAGIQYDIEPYLLPAYAADPGRILRAWAETLRSLGREAGTDLDIVLPFWLASDPDAKAVVLPAVAAAAKSVTVMAYRTGAAEIEAAARPLLAWGSSAGLPIRVALETGPVEDEVNITYAPASEGDLWALPAENGTLLLRLSRPQGGSARIFAPVLRTITEAGRVSFLGDEAAMMVAARASYPNLAAWPAFAGFAFHGLLP